MITPKVIIQYETPAGDVNETHYYQDFYSALNTCHIMYSKWHYNRYRLVNEQNVVLVEGGRIWGQDCTPWPTTPPADDESEDDSGE